MITGQILEVDNEKGSLDCRMLPVAATIWISVLLTHALFLRCSGWSDSKTSSKPMNHGFGDRALQNPQSNSNKIERISRFDMSSIGVFGLSLTLIITGVILIMVCWSGLGKSSKARGNGSILSHASNYITDEAAGSTERAAQRVANVRRHVFASFRDLLVVAVMRKSRGHRMVWVAVLACSALTGASACLSSDIAAYRDPAMLLLRGSGQVEAEVELESPVRASSFFAADCQADARLHSVGQDGVRQVSRSKIVLYAHQPWCAKLINGQVLSLTGNLKAVEHGISPLSLTVDKDASVRESRRAPPAKLFVDNIQRSFFSVTDGLSDQGRVLVPGLTIGLLGQDFVGHRERDPVDATFAAQLEMHFRDSGIMHLMAVSGGHFALVGDLVRSACAYFLLPRQAVCISTILAYAALAGAMYPSDSVMRALIMGVIVSLSKLIGRRAQVTSALAWTVVFTLLLDPVMSRSFGFALSCSSVLGIVLYSRRITRFFAEFFPTFLAESISVTLAAQMFTLPIQVLMTPELPLLSVPANLIVAPFVDWSTLTGLSALLLSPFSERSSFVFAWLSSCGTSVMRWCADTIGESASVTIPWAGGVAGSALVVIIELVIVGQVKIVGIISTTSNTKGRSSGKGIVASMKMRCDTWIKETKQMLENLDGTY